MQRYIFLSLVITAFLFSSVFSQPRRMQQRQFDRQEREELREERDEVRGLLNCIPDLTDEQQEQIENLRIEHLKAMKPIKDQIAEKRVQLRTMSTAEKVDMAKVNAIIDEIGILTTQLLKERINHQQSIRKMLTEKQRVIFDSMPQRMRGEGRGLGRW